MEDFLSYQRNLAEILSLKLADIEEKDEAEILALSVAVTHHQAIEIRLQVKSFFEMINSTLVH